MYIYGTPKKQQKFFNFQHLHSFLSPGVGPGVCYLYVSLKYQSTAHINAHRKRPDPQKVKLMKFYVTNEVSDSQYKKQVKPKKENYIEQI